MTQNNTVELEAFKVRFYSYNDEAAFFCWVDKLPCIVGYEGRGAAIYLQIESTAVDEECLRDLLSLFKRYGISMRQLSIFDRTEFSPWFRDKRAYWHSEIFGDD